MVYLIGAGPGNPGLITSKGLELLKQCDALVYDRLGTNELLEYAPKDCRKVYVGKRPGEHYRSQEEINEILVELAGEYKRIVRLKGGDPFVFGRGGEEIMTLKEHGIPFQVIPGITSAIAVPELLGIPVTHRETARSFHVHTGHTKDNEDCLSYVTKQEGSSVFLMGISNLERIVDRLIKEGEAPDRPVAIISNGTLPGETILRGTLSDIADKAKDKKIKSPAVIVVGDTASCSFVSDNISPINKKKLGVVGSRHFRENLRLAAEEKGAGLFSIISMEVKETEYIDRLYPELEKIEEYSWIVFTSANSIKLFFDKALECDIDYRRFANIKFAVVGSGTKRKLKEYGFIADFVPKCYTTKALAQGLSDYVTEGERLLIPRALRGSDELTKIFDTAGIMYKVLPIYDVVGSRTDNWKYLEDFDAILFASSSGVEAFVEELLKEYSIEVFERLRREKKILIEAIGEATAKTLANYGIATDIIPALYDSEGLIAGLEEYFTNYTRIKRYD